MTDLKTRFLVENETTGAMNSHRILKRMILSLPLILPTMEVQTWVSSMSWGLSDEPSIAISLVSPGTSSTRDGTTWKTTGAELWLLRRAISFLLVVDTMRPSFRKLRFWGRELRLVSLKTLRTLPPLKKVPVLIEIAMREYVQLGNFFFFFIQ